MPLSREKQAELQSQLNNLFTINEDNEKTAEIRRFLAELTTLMVDEPGAVLMLLQQQDHDNWSLGHFIACYQTDPEVVKAYLTLLNGLMTSQPEVASALLQQQDGKGRNIGHVIARQMNPKVVKTYLTFLNGLMTSQPDAAITLLQPPEGGGWNLGHAIARYQTDPELVKAYLALLNGLMTSQPEAAITLLQQQEDEDGWNLGHVIICKGDVRVVQVYFDFLSALVAQYPKYLEKVMSCLQQVDANSLTALEHLLKNHIDINSAESIRIYFDFLERLAQAYPVETIKSLESYKAEDGCKMEYIINYYGNTQARLYYLNFSKK